MKDAASRAVKRRSTGDTSGHDEPAALAPPRSGAGAKPDNDSIASRSVMPKQTTDADRMVGLRITALRKAKGLSQTALGQAIGVTFQQVQKYEKGQNRVGAGRLSEIAELLAVPVSTFFGEDDRGVPEAGEALAFLRTPGALDLLNAFARIEDTQTRRDVIALVRSIARQAGSCDGG